MSGIRAFIGMGPAHTQPHHHEEQPEARKPSQDSSARTVEMPCTALCVCTFCSSCVDRISQDITQASEVLSRCVCDTLGVDWAAQGIQQPILEGSSPKWGCLGVFFHWVLQNQGPPTHIFCHERYPVPGDTWPAEPVKLGVQDWEGREGPNWVGGWCFWGA